MKKLVTVLVLVASLAACKREEVKEMADDLALKKTEAVKLIEAGDRTLVGLMKIQDYFFTFSERVHLMVVDEDGKKAIQSTIKKVGVKSACESFVISPQAWAKLESFCAGGAFYKCSPEIKNYRDVLAKFMSASGEELEKSLKSEASCQ